MFSDTTALVAFSFRIINFGVLIFLASILYKRIMRSSIDQAIEQEEKDEQGLIQARGDLKSKQGILNEQIAQQQQLGMSLSEKIAQWRNTCSIKQQEQRDDKAAIQTAMINRAKLQANTIELQTIEKMVKPLVLVKMQQDLEKHFADQAHATTYLNDIVSYLKKETI